VPPGAAVDEEFIEVPHPVTTAKAVEASADNPKSRTPQYFSVLIVGRTLVMV
jgi:hypothetical protein